MFFGNRQSAKKESNRALAAATAREDAWPLKSLRRYGADDDVFSFESGRRCPMGEGIFAFK